MIIKVKDKVIGIEDSVNKIFTKKVKLSKHLLRVMDAWGIDLEYFKSKLLPDKYLIRIEEQEEKKVYEVEAGTFYTKGVVRRFGTHGSQIFLPRQYFNTDNTKQAKLL